MLRCFFVFSDLVYNLKSSSSMALNSFLISSFSRHKSECFSNKGIFVSFPQILQMTIFLKKQTFLQTILIFFSHCDWIFSWSSFFHFFIFVLRNPSKSFIFFAWFWSSLGNDLFLKMYWMEVESKASNSRRFCFAIRSSAFKSTINQLNLCFFINFLF